MTRHIWWLLLKNSSPTLKTKEEWQIMQAWKKSTIWRWGRGGWHSFLCGHWRKEWMSDWKQICHCLSFHWRWGIWSLFVSGLCCHGLNVLTWQSRQERKAWRMILGPLTYTEFDQGDSTAFLRTLPDTRTQHSSPLRDRTIRLCWKPEQQEHN